MRDEGWLLYRYGEKPLDTRKHEGKVSVKESDVRWCSDGPELSCDNGEKVRVAFALDCFDREIMSWVVSTIGIDAALVGDLMKQAVEYSLARILSRPSRLNGSPTTAAVTRQPRLGALPSNWYSNR